MYTHFQFQDLQGVIDINILEAYLPYLNVMDEFLTRFGITYDFIHDVVEKKLEGITSESIVKLLNWVI